jgi:pimeloyl-ACP methyl ester carboxylesterase
MTLTSSPTVLRHGRIDLALHQLRDGDGDRLLLLHGLGESSPLAVPSDVDAWSGPIWALDFTGHGASTCPRGGGYSAELLMADVDTALRHMCTDGRGCTIIGRGLGGWVALLIAGARAELVRGIVIADGPGLGGGGVRPTSCHIDAPRRPPAGSPATPDPYALIELATDVRPLDYAVRFVSLASELSPLEQPIAVASSFRPPWLAAIIEEPGVATVSSVSAGLQRIARQLRSSRP